MASWGIVRVFSNVLVAFLYFDICHYIKICKSHLNIREGSDYMRKSHTTITRHQEDKKKQSSQLSLPHWDVWTGPAGDGETQVRLHAWWSTQCRLATLLSSLIARGLVELQTLWRFRLKDLSIDEMVGAWCFGWCIDKFLSCKPKIYVSWSTSKLRVRLVHH